MGNTPLKEKAYNIIRDKIINCEYRPNSFLVEEELVNLVGTSRTPVREALMKLQEEKLIKIFPKRGIYVSEVTLNTVEKIFETRMLVEPYAVRNYCDRLPADIVKKELDYHMGLSALGSKTDSLVRGYQRDDELHRMIVAATQNEHIISMMDEICTHNYRLRVVAARTVLRGHEETKTEHIAILQKIYDHDNMGAAEALLRHLINGKERTLEAMTLKNGNLIW